jgi:hypothetical protein
VDLVAHVVHVVRANLSASDDHGDGAKLLSLATLCRKCSLPCLVAVLALLSVASGMWVPIVGAHGSDHATLRVIRTQQANWVFELQAPLSTLDDAMKNWNQRRGSSVENVVSKSTQHKELLVDYVKQTFAITVVGKRNGNDDVNDDALKPRLGKGQMRLADHNSVFRFEILNMPNQAGQLTFVLPFMQETPGHQNLLQLIDSSKSFRSVLDASNRYSLVETDFFAAAE